MAYYPPTVTIPVYAVFTAIAIGLTTLRFWARRQHLRTTPGIDDWLMVLGTFIVTACACIQFYNAIDGTGGAAVSPEDAESRAITAHRINFVMIVIEKPAFGAIKLSLCFFYKRIFDVWDSFRRANNFVIWIIILWTLSFALADILICGDELHFNFDADQTLGAKYCGDKGMLLLMFAVTSVITDLLVLALPFLYVRRLQMPKQKRWATIFVFCLGAA